MEADASDKTAASAAFSLRGCLKIVDDTGLCLGCARTRSEVAAWPSLLLAEDGIPPALLLSDYAAPVYFMRGSHPSNLACGASGAARSNLHAVCGTPSTRDAIWQRPVRGIKRPELTAPVRY